MRGLLLLVISFWNGYSGVQGYISLINLWIGLGG